MTAGNDLKNADLGSAEPLMATLARLAATIDARASDDDTASYTARLLASGPNACGKKLGEEAVECALALVAEDDAAVASEAADVLYHLLVALRSRGVALDAVSTALTSREGQSGLEEKAARKP